MKDTALSISCASVSPKLRAFFTKQDSHEDLAPESDSLTLDPRSSTHMLGGGGGGREGDEVVLSTLQNISRPQFL